MNINLHIERPLAATVLLASLLALGGLVLAAVGADLSAALAERDAKADFVMQSLRASRLGSAKTADQQAAGNLSIVAASETLAAAELDTLVRAKFVEAGSTVTSSQTEAKHEEAGIAGRIETRAVAEGTISGIQKALFGLESGTPLVLVDEISLAPVERTAASDAAREPTLQASVTFTAYWAAPTR